VRKCDQLTGNENVTLVIHVVDPSNEPHLSFDDNVPSSLAYFRKVRSFPFVLFDHFPYLDEFDLGGFWLGRTNEGVGESDSVQGFEGGGGTGERSAIVESGREKGNSGGRVRTVG
jgi:hypothetical protein